MNSARFRREVPAVVTSQDNRRAGVRVSSVHLMTAALAAFVVLVPVAYFPALYRPVIDAKHSVTAALALALCWIWARYLAQERPLRPKYSAVVWPLAAFLAAVFASAALSPFANAWLGWDHHREGAVTFLLYGLIFLSALQAARLERSLRWLLLGLLGGLAVTAATVLPQPFLAPRLWTPFRSSGLLGDPNQMGGYLLLLAPFAVAGLTLFPSRRGKLACLILGLAGYASLALTFSKAAYAGAVLQLIVLAAAQLRNRAARLSLAAGGTAALGGIALAWLVSPGSLGQLGLSAITLNLRARFDSWETAWNLWLERPVFGWGPDSFHFASKGVSGFGGAHSEYFHYLATLGVAGLGAFLAILVTSAWVIRSHPAKRDEDRALRLSALASIAGYLVYLTTTYNQPYIAAVFWIVLAMAIRTGTAPDKPAPADAANGDQARRPPSSLAAVMPLIVVLALGSQLIRLPLGATLLGQTVDTMNQRGAAEALPLARAALNAIPDSKDAWLIYARAHETAAGFGRVESLPEAIRAYRVVLKRHDPGHVETWMRLAGLYQLSGDNRRARNAAQKAKSLGAASKELDVILGSRDGK